MTDLEKQINENGVGIGKTEGDSMYPMLKTGDTVVIAKPTFPLKKYDVPVYHRCDHMTMHRILKVLPNGYIIRGDNRIYLERDITDKDIIGVLSGFYKNGELIDVSNPEYLAYVKKVTRFYYLKYQCGRVLNRLRRIFKKEH